ncbi:YbaY family lipoprotein [Ruegeria arenilitoris]|uniref:YbaY family lipoprotein n=1 Tax=Ruegeria arenilitoris TaxID=1173585 RepID=UPI0020C27224|nr:YbaY family lipoprotein [Ruegeria arenilitoris]
MAKTGRIALLSMMASATIFNGALAGTIEGTATYRERIAVRPGTTLFVELQDVSRADAPSVTLAAQRYALTGVPAPFELNYDDALIDDRMQYVVRATMYQGDKLLMTTDQAYPVITNGAGNSADLVLVQAAGQGLASLENSKWTAVGLNGDVLNAERQPQIEFAEGGTFGGTGGCNRFSGQVEISGNSINFPDNMAATLMACPPSIEEVEKQFFDALQKVTTYAVSGNSLVFLDEAGEPVVNFVRTP